MKKLCPTGRLLKAISPTEVKWDRLSEIETSVIRLRFGFETEKCLLLKEVGERLGLTREGVRTIESRSLRKLRRP